MERNSNDMSLREALQQFLNHSNLKPKMYESRVPTLWDEMMGPTISGYTREIKMKGNRLFLRIDSAPLRAELTIGREKLKNLLNDQLGEEYITEVIIR